jgi:hypothetical protein
MACELQSLRPTKTKTAATHDALIRWVDRTRDVDERKCLFPDIRSISSSSTNFSDSWASTSLAWTLSFSGWDRI